MTLDTSFHQFILSVSFAKQECLGLIPIMLAPGDPASMGNMGAGNMGAAAGTMPYDPNAYNQPNYYPDMSGYAAM